MTRPPQRRQEQQHHHHQQHQQHHQHHQQHHHRQHRSSSAPTLLLLLLTFAASAAAPAHAALDAGARGAGRAIGADRTAAALLLIGVVGGIGVVTLSALQGLLRRPTPPLVETEDHQVGQAARRRRSRADLVRAAMLLVALGAAAYIGALFLDFCIALNDQLNDIQRGLALLSPDQNPSRMWYMHGDLSVGVAHGLVLTTALFVAVQIAMMLLVFVCTEVSGVAPVEYAKRQEEVDGLGLGNCITFPCLASARARGAARDRERDADAAAAAAAARIHRHDIEPATPPSSDLPRHPGDGSSSAPFNQPTIDAPDKDKVTAAAPTRSPSGLSVTALWNFIRRHPAGCSVLVVLFVSMLSLFACGVSFARRARYLEPQVVAALTLEDVAGATSPWVSRYVTISRLTVVPTVLCTSGVLNSKGALSSKCIQPPLPPGFPTPPPSTGMQVSSLALNVSQCALEGGNSSAKLAACFTGFNNATGRPAVELPLVLDAFTHTGLFRKRPFNAVLGITIVCLLSVILVTSLWTFVLYAYGSRMCNMTFFFASTVCAVPLAVTLAASASVLLDGPIVTLVANVTGRANIPVLRPRAAFLFGGAGAISRVLINTTGAAIIADFFVLFIAAIVNPRDIVLGVNRITRSIATSPRMI